MSNRARPTGSSTWPDGTTDSSSSDNSPASNGSGQLRQPRPAPGPPAQHPRPPQTAPQRPVPTQRSQPTRPSAPGQYGVPTPPPTPASSPGESLSDRVTAARQAVKEKATAMRDAATQVTPTRPTTPRTTAATKTTPRTSTAPRTRKARLRLARIDPWSVMKTAFLLSIAFGIVTWVAVFIVWSAIGAAGVFDNINRTVSEVLGTPAAEPFRIEEYVGTNKVMGFTTLIACADVLILTALATLGAFLYNLAASLLGGLELTLASED